jgi:predicted transcriptional regulator
MKLTESRLKEIIQEELESVLNEQDDIPRDPSGRAALPVMDRLMTLRKALSGDEQAKLNRILDLVIANFEKKSPGKPIKTIASKPLYEPEKRGESEVMRAMMKLKAPTRRKAVAPVVPPRVSPTKE